MIKYQVFLLVGIINLSKDLLDGIEIPTNTDFYRTYQMGETGKKNCFTGKIDEFYNYKLGT